MRIMRKLKKVISLILGLSLLLFFASCSNDDPSPTGTVNLSVTSGGSNMINTRISSRVKAAVEITDFKISIRDIIFKTDVDDDGVSDDSTEVAFRGPFQLDLLNGGDAVTESLGTAEIPNGVYDELRFKFHKDEDLPASDPLFDRSIFVSGTIGDVPFEMWHDTSENLDVGRSTGVVVDGNQVNLTVVFTIDQFLNSLVQIDLTQAVDGNEDGVIEINTNDDDGNKDIADALKENIKAAADILDQ